MEVNIMPVRVISRIDNSKKACFKVIVPAGISREFVESLLSTKTPYKVNRPKRREIESINKILTISKALKYLEDLKFEKDLTINKEMVHCELVDSLWFKPFNIKYCPENNITFFNCDKEEGRKYCASELYFRCRDKDNNPNGNYYYPGEFEIRKEPKGNLFAYNIYRIYRENIIEKSTIILSR